MRFTFPGLKKLLTQTGKSSQLTDLRTNGVTSATTVGTEFAMCDRGPRFGFPS